MGCGKFSSEAQATVIPFIHIVISLVLLVTSYFVLLDGDSDGYYILAAALVNALANAYGCYAVFKVKFTKDIQRIYQGLLCYLIYSISILVGLSIGIIYLIIQNHFTGSAPFAYLGFPVLLLLSMNPMLIHKLMEDMHNAPTIESGGFRKPFHIYS
ncbi:hypothetical protein DSO57_1027432 [Entomophthora muscae]|uniref:Uncharacterized protein n=1 Tax=Entomophthora muscae TaxID=34485 RepID=A0ACC2UAU9_9FUNG|nr:hypothetical protein DSO57_1027432 [Entomophthora muscae]